VTSLIEVVEACVDYNIDVYDSDSIGCSHRQGQDDVIRLVEEGEDAWVDSGWAGALLEYYIEAV